MNQAPFLGKLLALSFWFVALTNFAWADCGSPLDKNVDKSVKKIRHFSGLTCLMQNDTVLPDFWRFEMFVGSTRRYRKIFSYETLDILYAF